MADNSKFIQTQTFKLAGGGISLSDTSISLQSFKFPDGNVITMSHIGALGTGTLEPGASKEEIISFTGVTQNGYETRYAHLSEIDVVVGQRVEKTEVIGKIGSTGNSTGPHLHFEMRYNEKTLNPLDYIQPPTSTVK